MALVRALVVVACSCLSSRSQVYSFGSTSAPLESFYSRFPLSHTRDDIVFGRHGLIYSPAVYNPRNGRNERNERNNHDDRTSLHSVLNPEVLTASSCAIAKLLSSIGLGALATPRGPRMLGRVLDGPSISALSKLTYWMFQPCFLMCSVASTLAAATSPAGAAVVAGIPKGALLLLPLASLFQIGLGGIAAKLITTRKFGVRPMLLGIDTDDDDGANDVKMCTTFSNSGPLPLILSDALFGGAILSDVSACISFYLLMWSPLFWSFGRVILGSYTDTKGENDTLRTKIASNLKKFFSPPVVGSILGVVIGSSSMLRDLMLAPRGALAPLFGAANTFGVAYLPAAVLVLAGSLAGAKKGEPSDTAEPPKVASSLTAKTVIAIMMSRFILSPVLAITTVRLLSVLKLLPVDDPRALAIVTFTLLMEGCMPPAQNSVIILQLDDKKERAAKMAKMLTVIYTLSVVPITLLLSGCLSLSGILNYL